MKDERRFVVVVLVIGVVFGLSITSEAKLIRLKVSGAKVDCVDVPVHADIELPEQLANVPVEEITVVLWQQREEAKSISYPGQLVMIGRGKAELWWVMPRVKANSITRWTAALSRREKADKEVFSWRDKEGEYLDLLFGGRKVTRYMYAYDNSTPQRAFETYKPLHHIFNAQGQKLLTNGPDGVHSYTRQIKYPHHRGIFIG